MKTKLIPSVIAAVTAIAALTVGLAQPASAATGTWNLNGSGCLLSMAAKNEARNGSSYARLDTFLSSSTGPCARYRLIDGSMWYLRYSDKKYGTFTTASNPQYYGMSANQAGYYKDGFVVLRDSTKSWCFVYWLHPGATVISKGSSYMCA